MESSGNLALTVQEIRHHGGAETGCQCGCEREVPLEGGEGGPGRDGLLCGAAQHPEDSRGGHNGSSGEEARKDWGKEGPASIDTRADADLV